MDNLRTFIAIDIKVESSLKSKWDELKLLLINDSVKWVDERTIHLTLFFLGETSAQQVKEVSRELEIALKDTQAFLIQITGLGTFGNPANPKVIWAGIFESKPLQKLKEKVDIALLRQGFEDSQSKFSPHLTLGRIKHIKSANELNNFLKSNKVLRFYDVEVGGVIFYQSILTPNGPIYKPLKEIKLPSL